MQRRREDSTSPCLNPTSVGQAVRAMEVELCGGILELHLRENPSMMASSLVSIVIVESKNLHSLTMVMHTKRNVRMSTELSRDSFRRA